MSDEEGYVSLPEDYMDVEESVILAEGLYDLVISKAEYKLSKKNNPMFFIIIDIMDDPNSDGIMYNLNIPKADSHKMVKREFKRFMVTFDVQASEAGLCANDIIGCQANTGVGVEQYKGKNKNVLNLPPLD